MTTTGSTETIGMRLRKLRREHGLSVHAVGQKIRMNGDYLCEVEAGKHQPGVFMVIDLAKLFGVSLDYIAGLTEHQNNPYVKRT